MRGSVPATQWVLNSGVKCKASLRLGLWTRLSYPAHGPVPSDSLLPGVPGKRVEDDSDRGGLLSRGDGWAWARPTPMEVCCGGVLGTGAPSLMPLSPQVPLDVMARLWLSCLLLPALLVSGACLPSPTRATLIWGP